MSIGSKKKFKELFEEQTINFDQKKSFLHDLDPLITMYAGVIFSLVSSLTLCITKKSRDILKKYLKECKETMIWNGLIAFLDACYISYCLQLASAIKD